MKNSEGYPKAHAKYVVRREDALFMATPCYGMHEPWWVVRIMGEKYEADPEPMLETDEWWPVDEFEARSQVGVGELVEAAEKVLSYRGMITEYPPRTMVEHLERIPKSALDRLAATVQKIQQGRPSEPSDPTLTRISLKGE